MGNPETLDDETLDFLTSVGVTQFQMSLDGLEKTHDFYRGAGSFRRTLEGLDKLAAHQIRGSVMFTLTNENKQELIPLLNFVEEHTRARSFAFDLVCGVGNAKDITTYISKKELLSLYEAYQSKRQELLQQGSKLKVTEKSALFRILNYRDHSFYPYNNAEFPVANGCYVGYHCFTILADGSAAACRRFPEIIGKMPEQSFEEVFLGSPLLRRFRRAASYEKCGTCRLYQYCRGCPAETYGFYQNPFRENVHCFAEEALPDKNLFSCSGYASPPINISFSEEAKLIKSTLQNQYVRDYPIFMKNAQVMQLIGLLLADRERRTEFLMNPHIFVQKYHFSVSEKYQAYICYYFDCLLRGKVSNPIGYILDL